MPRIRTIKPESFQDEKLAPLDPTTRLVFLGLISMADDMGRVLDNVRIIDAFIFPETDDSAREPLATLSRIARIRRGKTSSGQRIIQIVNWEKHQKVDHPNVKGSFPEIVEPEAVAEIREPLARDSREIREPLAPHTNDQRPTTSTNDQRPLARQAAQSATPLELVPQPPARPARPRRESIAQFPGFPRAVCDAAHECWRAEAGAVDYGQFRKAFGPLFEKPEAERPPALPRDDELIPAIRAYLGAIAGTSAARFLKPENCAKYLTQIVHAMRESETTEQRQLLVQHAMGLTEEVRRINRGVA